VITRYSRDIWELFGLTVITVEDVNYGFLLSALDECDRNRAEQARANQNGG
jgi:hypothetical protein